MHAVSLCKASSHLHCPTATRTKPLTSGTSGSTRAWRDARGGDLWGLTAFTPHPLRGETGKGQNGVWAAKTSDLEQRMVNVHTHAGERVSSLVGFSFEGKRSSWVTLPRFCSELQWLKVKSSGEEELNPHTISLRMLASFQPGNHKAHRMNCHATNNERLVCRASLN